MLFELFVVLALALGVGAFLLSRGIGSDAVVHFVTEYRAVFIILFLIPFSIFYDIYMDLRKKYLIWYYTRNTHADRVKHVQDQVKRWAASGSKKPMCTARPGWANVSHKHAQFKVDCSQISIELYDVVEINEKKRTVKVEPLATMGQVTAQLIPKGWTLAVVPELDDLTVGGLLMGFGVETSSHRYGLFQDICESFEVVLADGSVVTATEKENVDLFRALPWSHGTLGFLTMAELKIVPAKPFVELTYYPFHNKEKAMKFFEETTTSPKAPEYVEGLAYSNDDYVIMTGELVDRPNPSVGQVNEIGKWYKPWFFIYVRSLLKKEKIVEYVPLRQYYHRHTRSLFWEMEHVIPYGNALWFRYLLGWWTPKISLLKITETQATHNLFNSKFVFQDMLVPLDRLSKTLTFFHENYDIYPIWLCAHKVFNTKPQGFLKPTKKNVEWEMYVDVGAYGPPKRPYNNLIDMPKMERFVIDNHGYQALYAVTYMNKDEFREMFDHTLYDQLRKKYNAEDAFPDVYTKVANKRKSK